MHPLKFHTNRGEIVFNVWDTAGARARGGGRGGRPSSRGVLPSPPPYPFVGRPPRRDPNLQFVESPALVPPEIHIDQGHIEQMKREEQEALLIPLPDEDEDL